MHQERRSLYKNILFELYFYCGMCYNRTVSQKTGNGVSPEYARRIHSENRIKTERRERASCRFCGDRMNAFLTADRFTTMMQRRSKSTISYERKSNEKRTQKNYSHRTLILNLRSRHSCYAVRLIAVGLCNRCKCSRKGHGALACRRRSLESVHQQPSQ